MLRHEGMRAILSARQWVCATVSVTTVGLTACSSQSVSAVGDGGSGVSPARDGGTPADAAAHGDSGSSGSSGGHDAGSDSGGAMLDAAQPDDAAEPDGSCPAGLPCAVGWYEVPNTAIAGLCPTYSDIQGTVGCPAVMAAWGTALVDTKRNRLVIHGGGHVDYYGNEIYAVDFDARPISAVLVHDASHGSGIANLGSCPEIFSDGMPNSRHGYNGLWYLPTQDEYWMYGAGLSICGDFSDGQWVFSPTAGSWTSLSNTGHPDSAENGSTPQFAYDSVTDSLYEVESNTGTFWQYTIASNVWTSLSDGGGCGTDNATSAIDPVHRLYLCVGSGDFHTVSLTAPYDVTDVSSAPGCSALVSAPAPGFAFDPVQNLLVGYIGGNDVTTYDPVAKSCTSQSHPGGPSTVQNVGTYGRFQYMPGLAGFVYAGSTTTNVWFLRL